MSQARSAAGRRALRRTTHGFPLGRLRGRRRRWTLAMALLPAASLAVLARQASVAEVAILWILFSAFQNGEYASLSAAIPDHVPVRQRATVAAWVGMPEALGLVASASSISPSCAVSDRRPARGAAGGHPTLFAATAIVAAAGTVFVWKIKSVP